MNSNSLKTAMIILISGMLHSTAHGQAPAGSTAPATNMKSEIRDRMAYDSVSGGNAFTAAITARISTPLSLSVDQTKQMNTGLFTYFAEKSSFSELRRTDKTSYEQRCQVLLDKFIHSLHAYLSDKQVRSFMALKPPAGKSPDPMAIVFY